MASVQPPFTYQALPPGEISFVPLKQTRKFSAPELFQVKLPPSPSSQRGPVCALFIIKHLLA